MSELAEGRIVEGLAGGSVATREQLETILRNVTDGITVMGRDGRFHYANVAAARLCGFESPEELVGAPIEAVRERFMLFHVDGSPLQPEELPGRRAFAGEAPEDILVRFRRADGGSDSISAVRAVPILDERGEVELVVNFFRDVTEERRRAAREQLMAEAGALFGASLDYERTLERIVGLAVPRLAEWASFEILGEDGQLRRVAAAYADDEKRAVAEEIARRWPAGPNDVRLEVVRSGEPMLMREVTDEVLRAGASSVEHLAFLREIGLASAIIAPVVVRGESLGVITLATSDTARRFDESDLESATDLARRGAAAIDNARLFRETKRSETLLDTLFATAPVGLGFWDRELRYVRLNAALAEINGLTPEQHLGRRLREVLPDLDPQTYEIFDHVIGTGEAVLDVELGGETPARPGVRRTWLCSYYPVVEDEQVVGLGAVISEVTERRRAERRLEVQHAVAHVLAESGSISEAIPRLLLVVCDSLDWEVGAFWSVDPDLEEQRCEFVHGTPELQAFVDATLVHRVRRGVSLAGEIWERGEPRWIADLSERDDVPQGREAASLGVRTGFGFPALVGGEVVGIFEFFATERRRTDPELLAVAGGIGRQLGQVVRRTRAEDERARLLIAERAARAEAEAAAATLRKLERVSQVALAHISLSDLLDALLAEIVATLDADTAAILLLDEASGDLTARATFGLEELLDLAKPVPLGKGLAGRVAASRTPVLVEELDEIELVSPVLRARGIHSVVAIPLVVEESVIGVVHVGAEQPRRFGGEHARLLELMADRIALAVNQSSLYEAERDAQRRLGFLAEATSLLASSLEYEDTLARVADLAVPYLADWCSVDMLAPGGSFERLAVAHVDPATVAWAWEIADELKPDPDDPNPYGVAHVLRTGEPAILATIPQELVDQAVTVNPALADVLHELHLRSLMIVPLKARGRVLGAMTFVRAESRKTYGEADLAVAMDLAGRAAVAVDNAVLYRAAGEGRARLEFLAEATALLGSSLDYESTLRRLGALVAGRIADWCSIHLADESGTVRLVTVAHRDPDRAAGAHEFASGLESAPDAETSVAKVVRTGEAELLPVIPPELLSGAAEEIGIHSALIVPLNARGRTLGTIALARAEIPQSYGETDLAFAEDLARRAAIAIDNAQLYRAAEDRAQATRVLAAVGDGVFLVDGLGLVRYWNRAAEAITRLSSSEVIDRPAAEAIPGWAAIASRVPIAGEGAPAPRAESLPLGVGGRDVWLSISGVAVADGVVYAFRDLTEERALDTLKTEFVSTVSHELRTPLAAIYGAAMTLRREDVDLGESQRANLLGVVSNEADRLARTVNSILWASRLDTDTLKVAIESCDAHELTANVIEAQRAHLPRGIELETSAPSGVPRVAADPDKVRQVLVNLVDNAVKYSPDGGRVEVRLEPVGSRVRFAVSDQGLGIPVAEHRRIFDKFYRLDPNMTRGIGGTGLGLYICREIVRRMDGRIWVESEPGRGSTFTFELPVAGTDSDVAAHLAP